MWQHQWQNNDTAAQINTAIAALPKPYLHLVMVEGVNGRVGDGLLVSAEVPSWALREVDRLNRNPEKPANAGGKVMEGHHKADEILRWIQQLPYPA
jgi:hypothetical protein